MFALWQMNNLLSLKNSNGARSIHYEYIRHYNTTVQEFHSVCPNLSRDQVSVPGNYTERLAHTAVHSEKQGGHSLILKKSSWCWFTGSHLKYLEAVKILDEDIEYFIVYQSVV